MTLLTSFQIRATEKEEPYFFPRLHSSLWPNFCSEHLWQYPEACSEQDVDSSGHVQSVFSQKGSSECQIDKDLLSALSWAKERIPYQASKCEFLFCPICHSPVFRHAFTGYDPSDDDGNYEDEEDSVCLRCPCLNYWYADENLEFYQNDVRKDPPNEQSDWTGCTRLALPHHYFDSQHKQFFPFLEQHLAYVQQNPSCLHYWPYRSKIACEISDLVYNEVDEHPYIENLTETDHPISDFPYFSRTQHGILLELFAHAFFYTQYRQILLFLAEWA